MLFKNGKQPFLAIALLLLNSCRSSIPPAIDLCQGDGFGGADCILVSGSPLRPLCSSVDDTQKNRFKCPPSALLNTWITTQQSEKIFAAWCYDTSSENIEKAQKDLFGRDKKQ